MKLLGMEIPELPIGGNDAILVGLCPALIGLTVMAAVGFMPLRRREWGAPIAMALGFMAAYFLVNGTPPAYPPKGAGDWLFWLSLPAGIVVAVISGLKFSAVLRTVIAAGLYGTLLYFMMGLAKTSRTAAEWWMLWVILVGILTIDSWFADRAIRNDNGLTSLIGLIAIFFGAGVLIAQSGSIKFFLQSAGAVSAAVAVLAVTWMAWPRRSMAHGVAMMGIAIVGSLLAVSIEPLFVNVTISNALLIATAPVLLWVGQFIKLPIAPAWLRSTVRLALPAIVVLAALSISGMKALKDSQASEGDYSGYSE